MIYVVNEIMMKDWDDQDSIKMLMVADNPNDVIKMAGTMDEATLKNIFVTEIGTPTLPINKPIINNLLDCPGTPISEFLATHSPTPATSKKKKI